MDRLDSDRMFLAVIETGSFTAAAEKLGTRSGQASKMISRLETELVVRLLNRTTRSVAPTTTCCRHTADCVASAASRCCCAACSVARRRRH